MTMLKSGLLFLKQTRRELDWGIAMNLMLGV